LCCAFGWNLPAPSSSTPPQASSAHIFHLARQTSIMRHGRAKAARKTLQFYALNANIKAPYHIILDGNFLAASIRQKVPLYERISKTLQKTEFSFYVTRSALDELASLPGELFQQARQFGLDECEIIERNAIPGKKNDETCNTDKGESTSSSSLQSSLGEPGDDIRLLVTDGTNRHGYFVGTQDEGLSDTLRDLPYVPQLRLSRGVLLLEAPSSASRRKATSQERNKMISGGGLATKEEKEMVAALREKERAARKRKAEEARRASGAEGGAGGGSEYSRRSQKKAKGPNPLSCKKSKAGDDIGEKKKKRRRKGKSSGNAVS